MKIYLEQNVSSILRSSGGRSAADFATVFLIASSFAYTYILIWDSSISGVSFLNVDTDVKVIAIVLFCCSFIIKLLVDHTELFQLNLIKLSVFVVLLLFAIFYYKTTRISTLIFAALLGFALHKDSTYKIIKISGIIAFVFFFADILLFTLGILKDTNGYQWIREYSNGDTFQRLAFGFGHPNRVFAFFLPSCLSVYYMRKSICRSLCIFLCIITLLFILFATDTKTLIIVGILLLLSPALEYLLTHSSIVRVGSIFLFPILTFVSIALALIGGENWNSKINQMFSYRPAFWLRYIQNGFHLLSATDANSALINASGDQEVPLDNYFLAPLYVGGFLAFLGLCVLHMILTYKVIRVKNFKLLVIIIQTMLYGLSESQLQLGTSLLLPLFFSCILDITSISGSLEYLKVGFRDSTSDVGLVPSIRQIQ